MLSVPLTVEVCQRHPQSTRNEPGSGHRGFVHTRFMPADPHTSARPFNRYRNTNTLLRPPKALPECAHTPPHDPG